MKIDDKTLYARIVDPNGLADGLQGFADTFQLATDLEDLEAIVGSSEVIFYVEAPNTECAGWRYENGNFIDPAS